MTKGLTNLGRDSLIDIGWSGRDRAPVRVLRQNVRLAWSPPVLRMRGRRGRFSDPTINWSGPESITDRAPDGSRLRFGDNFTTCFNQSKWIAARSSTGTTAVVYAADAGPPWDAHRDLVVKFKTGSGRWSQLLIEGGTIGRVRYSNFNFPCIACDGEAFWIGCEASWEMNRGPAGKGIAVFRVSDEDGSWKATLTDAVASAGGDLHRPAIACYPVRSGAARVLAENSGPFVTYSGPSSTATDLRETSIWLRDSRLGSTWEVGTPLSATASDGTVTLWSQELASVAVGPMGLIVAWRSVTYASVADWLTGSADTDDKSVRTWQVPSRLYSPATVTADAAAPVLTDLAGALLGEPPASDPSALALPNGTVMVGYQRADAAGRSDTNILIDQTLDLSGASWAGAVTASQRTTTVSKVRYTSAYFADLTYDSGGRVAATWEAKAGRPYVTPMGALTRASATAYSPPTTADDFGQVTGAADTRSNYPTCVFDGTSLRIAWLETNAAGFTTIKVVLTGP